MEVERLNAEQGFAVEIPMPNGQTETFLLTEFQLCCLKSKPT